MFCSSFARARAAVAVAAAVVIWLGVADRASAGTVVEFRTNWDPVFEQVAAGLGQDFAPLRFEMYDDDDQVQANVDNFLNYANTASYIGSFFHRYTNPVSDGIGVLQGGGFAYEDYELGDRDSWLQSMPSGTLAPDGSADDPMIADLTMLYHDVYTNAPVELEAVHSHTRGTIGAARTTDPDSATSQFYINFTDNTSLDGNYTVFGEVVDEAGVFTGMDLIDFLLDTRLLGDYNLNDDQYDNTAGTAGEDGLRDWANWGSFGETPLFDYAEINTFEPFVIVGAEVSLEGVGGSGDGPIVDPGDGGDVPEPATLTLLALGGLAMRRRKR